MEEMLRSETKVKQYLHQNTELTRTIDLKRFEKVIEKSIRVEILVPEIKETIVEVDRYIERPSVDAKLELSKKERAEIKHMVRTEVNGEI
jgi:hypothetical protein